MEKKKDFTIEELEKQCLEAEKAFKTLHEKLIQAKKEEEETKKVKLRAEKNARYKEVVHAYENFEELRSKFVDDYGYFTFETETESYNLWGFFFKR